MAIIYSYPEIGTIAAGDLMPITDVSDTQFPTKSVTLTDLATYFSAKTVTGLDPQQLVTFNGGNLKSLEAGTAGQYMLSQGAGVYPTWNDVPWINLSQYNLPYWNGSSFTDSIIKVQPNQNLPTIEVGETGDMSTKMKIFGGLEIEPAQPDFTGDNQFVVKSDNSLPGSSQQPKISVPSTFDRVGINTLNPNAALVVGPGNQTDGKILGIVKQSGMNFAYMYFSTSIGTGNQVTNGIVYESNTVGVAPEQKGDRISFFTQSPTGGAPQFEQGKKANAPSNITQNYIALPGIEEWEQGNIPGPGFNSYSYIPQDGLYVDQGVVKVKRTGMETQTSIILASPNGTKYKVTVNDTGVLTTTAL